MTTASRGVFEFDSLWLQDSKPQFLMINKYSDEIIDLLKRTYPELANAYRLEFKNFFGSAVGYVDGNIFVSCGGFGVAFKLPAQTLDELFAMEDVEHLKYFSKAHIKKEYAVLPERILKDEKQFKKLVDESTKFVAKSS